MDNVENKYFNWLYDYVCEKRFPDSISYKKVLTLLHQTEFTWSIPMDENRAGDGIDLRRRFSYEMCHDYNRMAYEINSPCSVLEMMLALAIRCEETIMDDTRYGDRTCEWFWKMMKLCFAPHLPHPCCRKIITGSPARSLISVSLIR